MNIKVLTLTLFLFLTGKLSAQYLTPDNLEYLLIENITLKPERLLYRKCFHLKETGRLEDGIIFNYELTDKHRLKEFFLEKNYIEYTISDIGEYVRIKHGIVTRGHSYLRTIEKDSSFVEYRSN